MQQKSKAWHIIIQKVDYKDKSKTIPTINIATDYNPVSVSQYSQYCSICEYLTPETGAMNKPEGFAQISKTHMVEHGRWHSPVGILATSLDQDLHNYVTNYLKCSMPTTGWAPIIGSVILSLLF